MIHERLEREIHPEEILVVTETREDVWGLRSVHLISHQKGTSTDNKKIHYHVVRYAISVGPGDV